MRKTRAIPFLLITALLCSVILISAADCMDRAFRHRREQACLSAVYDASKEFALPVPMILAVIRTESDFRPTAISSAGAMGLMQLMPSTFRYLTEDIFKDDLSPDAITDPAVNIRYGSYYLTELYTDFGDWPAALAAFNAGKGRVRKWLADNELCPDGILVHIPFPETARYVEKVLDAYSAYCRIY